MNSHKVIVIHLVLYHFKKKKEKDNKFFGKILSMYLGEHNVIDNIFNFYTLVITSISNLL